MKILACVIFLLSAMPVVGQVQQGEIDLLKQDIDLFADVLEEALDLDQNSGLFGLSLGGVDPVYVRGQGLVVEVRSQLATRRNRLNLASLNSTMQSLRSGENPFDAFRRRNAANGNSIDLSADADSAVESANSFYQQMMQRVADLDYSLVINTAIQQAANSVRSLRSLGDINEEDYQQLRRDLDALRTRMDEGLESIRSLQQQARSATADSEDSLARESEISDRLDELLASFQPLRDEALAKARELQARMDQAEADYEQRWRADIVQFEARLYSALCDFSAPLRRLPDEESLAVVLQGLGDETNNQATDKLHVISLAAIRSCQQGSISAEQLQSQSVSYSY